MQDGRVRANALRRSVVDMLDCNDAFARHNIFDPLCQRAQEVGARRIPT
jgi:hypothetical protein